MPNPLALARRDWIRQARPDDLRRYIDTGSYGLGRPTDLAPRPVRLADVRRAGR